MSTADEIEDSSAPLIEHLAELRTRLIRSVGAFLVGMVICFTFGGAILDFLLVPIENTMRALGDPNPVMQYTAPQEYFFTLVRVSVVGGLILSFPIIANQLWRFVAPGLYKNEKNAFLPFLIASPFMFLLGASFAFYVVTPLAYDFFLGFQQFGGEGQAVEPGMNGAPLSVVFQGSAQEYLNLTVKFIVAFGMCFQLPVLLTLMGKAGLVNSEGLRNVRKYAVVGILVLAALVAPPDVITQIILFVVVYGLYEVSIQLVKRVERQREAKLRAEGLWFEDDEEAADVAEAEAEDEASK